jgi:hypothetical protein
LKSLGDSAVFKNATTIISADLIKLAHSNEVCCIYSVVDPRSEKEHFVNLKYDDEARVVKATCSCTIQSLKSKHLPLCSHIAAAIAKQVSSSSSSSSGKTTNK